MLKFIPYWIVISVLILWEIKMDGFRDRMNRGPADRGSYDRYDRGSRRSSYGAPAPSQPSFNPDEIAQLVEDSNAKQLDVINDFFEDAKVDRFESEKQIISAIDEVIAEVKEVKKVAAEQAIPAPAPVQVPQSDNSEISNEILKVANSNADLLAQFAEEQVPMLIRGNSAVLNQIRESILESDETLRELVRNSNKPQASSPAGGSSLNDEVLSAATTNNALLNALRSDIAAVQSEIRSANERMSANADDNNAPLDTEDGFTKAQADEMYKNMEDLVHGECVKVYRNVQKVLEDQNVAVAETVKSSVGGLKGLAIINLILLLLNLVAVVANILEII